MVLSELTSKQRRLLVTSLNGLHHSKGLPILEIARGIGRSQSFLWRLCEQLNVEMRHVAAANTISALQRTKTRRNKFSGVANEKAYKLGFSSGDLTVWQVSGTNVMVTSTTTHPAFVVLFRAMFARYGPIYQYPMYEEGKGYRWKVATRLDNSFQFLLTRRVEGLAWASSDPRQLLEWLAGFVDSDGNIQVSRVSKTVRVKLNLYNTNLELLLLIKEACGKIGFRFDGPYLTMPKGSVTPYATYTKDMWNLTLQRTWEARKLIRRLPLQHRERRAARLLVISITKGVKWEDIRERIIALRRRVKAEVTDFAREAEQEYVRRHSGKTKIQDSDTEREK